MRYYIEAYYPDGSPMLGNLDGQASLNVRSPERTALWRAIKSGEFKRSCVGYWQLVDASGRVLDTKKGG